MTHFIHISFMLWNWLRSFLRHLLQVVLEYLHAGFTSVSRNDMIMYLVLFGVFIVVAMEIANSLRDPGNTLTLRTLEDEEAMHKSNNSKSSALSVMNLSLTPEVPNMNNYDVGSDDADCSQSSDFDDSDELGSNLWQRKESCKNKPDISFPVKKAARLPKFKSKVRCRFQDIIVAAVPVYPLDYRVRVFIILALMLHFYHQLSTPIPESRLFDNGPYISLATLRMRRRVEREALYRMCRMERQSQGDQSRQLAVPDLAEVSLGAVGGTSPGDACNGHGQNLQANELTELEKENCELKRLRYCRVCLCIARSVMFEPCNHLVCCKDCADRLVKCPVCRTLIATKKTVLFMPPD